MGIFVETPETVEKLQELETELIEETSSDCEPETNNEE
jgi:hypothetical protein